MILATIALAVALGHPTQSEPVCVPTATTTHAQRWACGIERHGELNNADAYVCKRGEMPAWSPRTGYWSATKCVRIPAAYWRSTQYTR